MAGRVLYPNRVQTGVVVPVVPDEDDVKDITKDIESDDKPKPPVINPIVSQYKRQSSVFGGFKVDE